MKTLVTTVTERGQVSIPAEIREQLHIQPGQRLVWEKVSDSECRVRLRPGLPAPGAVAMLGYAKRFRKARRTREWIAELREGDA
jgi:AbrB family looped-hinge helix DNA binding protein